MPNRSFGFVGQVDLRVRNAIKNREPVVALESTIISHGMPYPQNLEMAKEVEEIVRSNGAVPATIALIDGKARIGLDEESLEKLARAGVGGPDEKTANVVKCGAREMPLILARGGNGATTVAGTAALADRFNIDTFATGGIGGVHRGAQDTFDISADLVQLSRSSVSVVCAGVKSVLDIPRTLEYLETQGVPTVTYTGPIPSSSTTPPVPGSAKVGANGIVEFPAFFSPNSGVPSPAFESSLATIAKAKAISSSFFRWDRGQIIAVPPPESVEGEQIEAAIQRALREADEKKIAGRDVTPFLLSRINQLTEGASLKANIALVKRNAAVAAALAVEQKKAVADVQVVSATQLKKASAASFAALMSQRKAKLQKADDALSSASGSSEENGSLPSLSEGQGPKKAALKATKKEKRSQPRGARSASPNRVTGPALTTVTSHYHFLATGSGAAAATDPVASTSVGSPVVAPASSDSTNGQEVLARPKKLQRKKPAAAPGPLHTSEQRRSFHSAATAAFAIGRRLFSTSTSPPKVVVIGGAVVDIISRPKEGNALVNGTSNPGVVTQTFGGVGAFLLEGPFATGSQHSDPLTLFCFSPLFFLFAGRNVAEVVSRLGVQPVALITALGQQQGARKGTNINSDSDCDWAGQALAQHASSQPLNIQVFSPATSVSPSARSPEEQAAVRTPIYSAMLDGKGELVAAVADMEAFDRLLTPQAVTQGELRPMSTLSDSSNANKADLKSLLASKPRFVVIDGNVPAPTVKAVAATVVKDSAATALVYEPISIAKGVRVVEADALSSITVIKPNRYEVHALAKAIREKMGLAPVGPESDDDDDDDVGEKNEAGNAGKSSGKKGGKEPSIATVKQSFVGDEGGSLKPTSAVTTVKDPSGRVTSAVTKPKQAHSGNEKPAAASAGGMTSGSWTNLATSLIKAQQAAKEVDDKDKDGEDEEESGGEEDGSVLSALDYGLLTAAQTVLSAMTRPTPLGSSSAPGPVLEGATTGGALGALQAFSAATGVAPGSASPPPTPPASEAGRLVEGRKHVLVTLGAEGVLWLSAPPAASSHASDLMAVLPFFLAAGHPSLGMDFKLIPAPKVEEASIAKVTGAGDTFIGAVLASLAQGLSMAQALRHGLAAAKIAIEKPALATGAGLAISSPNPSTINASLCWPVVASAAEAFVAKVDEGYD